MRLAHFSDPHLLSLDGARVRDFLSKRWIGGLNLLVKRARQHSIAVFEALLEDLEAQDVDHAVCTGDVTNLALPSEARLAAELFSRLRIGPPEVTVIPGNHDAYVAGGPELFEQHLGDYFACDEAWRWPDGSRWPSVRVRGRVAVIALSTSLVTPWFRAWGRLGEEQLERLEAVLADSRLADKFRLVALHHPPVGSPAESRGAGLRDHQAFVAAIAAHGADLVLHGHEHLDLAGEIPAATPNRRPVPVRGIPSATYVGHSRKARAAYRIYELAAEEGASSSPANRPVVARETLRFWDVESQRFVEDE